MFFILKNICKGNPVVYAEKKESVKKFSNKEAMAKATKTLLAFKLG
jgi:hypothetical protein